MQLWISYSLYLFESNGRSATVVGMVGAGSIGEVLWEIIRSYYFSETCPMIIIIVITGTLIDLISTQIRKRFI